MHPGQVQHAGDAQMVERMRDGLLAPVRHQNSVAAGYWMLLMVMLSQQVSGAGSGLEGQKLEL